MSNNNALTIGIIILAIIGIVAYSLSKNGVIPNPSVSPTISASPSSIPTLTPQPSIIPTPSVDVSDWKTYRNKDYGYSLEYPSSWIIKTRENYQVHFLAPEGNRIIDDSWVGEGNIFITMNKLQNNQNSNPPSQYYSKSVIIIDGIKAIRYEGVKGGQEITNPSFIYTIVDLVENNKELNIIFSDQISDKNDDKYIVIYNKILSSFKFIK